MSIQKVSSFQDEGGKLKAVASGTLPNGKPVIVNSDGTVSVVSGASGSETVGTEVTYNAANSQDPAAVYDPDTGKVIIAFRDYGNSGKGHAVVGTISGTSISFGTKVQYSSGDSSFNSIAYDPVNQKVIIAFRDGGSGNRARLVIGTVSGTSISFNSPTNLHTDTANNLAGVTYDASTGSFVVAWSDQGNGYYGTAIAGQIGSGGTITLGTKIIYNSAVTYHSLNSVAYDPVAERVIVPYKDNGNSGRGTAVVLTGSGTSLSAGTPVVFETASTDNNGLTTTYDSVNEKIVITYLDASTAVLSAVVGTVSGTSISFGTPVSSSFGSQWVAAAYDSFAQKVIINFKNNSNSGYGTVMPFVVSGTTGAFDTATAYNTATTQYIGAAYDSTNQKTALVFTDWGTDYYGKVAVYAAAYNTSNLTATNYIGISTGGAVADTGSATVDIIGSMNDAQTGLTAGQAYYVQTDGTLSTTADDPSVFAGTAINGTTILVKS